MPESPFLLIHICGATVGLLSGAAVMAMRKGTSLHRLTGDIFVISMLGMTSSASYMAAFTKPNRMNFMMGVLTFYLVASGWVAARRRDGEAGVFELGAGLVALLIGASDLIVGFQTPARDGAPVLFIFGPVALLAGASDIRMYMRGGVAGAQRVARHLWRMCLALSIAVLSFFIGQQKLFPDSIRKTHVLSVPPLLMLGLTIFWMCRVSFSKAYRRKRIGDRHRDATVKTLAGAEARPAA